METYIIRQEGTNLYKIGKSSMLGNRINQLQTGNPNKLIIYATSEGNSEWLIHNQLETKNKIGELYELKQTDLKEVLRVMAFYSLSKRVTVYSQSHET